MKNIIIITLVIIESLVFAQTGPGGIGETNGSSELVFWLDANTINQTNGTDVSTWSDLSGYNNDALAVAGSDPVYIENNTNGLPTVQFSATNTDYLRVNDDASLNPSEISIFIVGEYSPTASVYAPFLVKTNNYVDWSQGYGISRFDGTDAILGFVTEWEDNTVRSNLANSTPTIMSLVYDKTSVGMYFNENLEGTDAYTANIVPTSNYLYLGISPDGAGGSGNGTGVQNPLDGNISEAIIINRGVNSAERIIIHNYLSSKYGFTLADNDVYIHDNNVNGDYDHEVAGIGRINAANTHTDSQGSGIVRISNPSGLGNNQFLLWGHDNGLVQANVGTDYPTGIAARLDRVWRVSEANVNNGNSIDVGNIDITFDLTDLGPVTTADLVLLVDDNEVNGFTDATIVSGATNISGNLYQFTAVSEISDNSRFTIGTVDQIATPLPIELLSFDALPTNNQLVDVEWKTASELNNEYFTIERSLNGENWEKLMYMDGAFNSSTVINYSFTDESPLEGISYYRLKQTDFDGEFSYSKIVSVNLESVEENVSIYPNPATDLITIVGIQKELSDIKIFNALGADVTPSIELNNKGLDEISIDLSNLKNGMYLINTSTTSNIVSKQ